MTRLRTSVTASWVHTPVCAQNISFNVGVKHSSSLESKEVYFLFFKEKFSKILLNSMVGLPVGNLNLLT